MSHRFAARARDKTQYNTVRHLFVAGAFMGRDKMRCLGSVALSLSIMVRDLFSTAAHIDLELCHRSQTAVWVSGASHVVHGDATSPTITFGILVNTLRWCHQMR